MCFDIPPQWWTREEAAVASRHRKENFSLNENSYLRAICKPNIYACLLIARERRGIRLMGINWYRESFPRRSPPATERWEMFAFSFYLFFLLLLIEASSSQLHVVLIPRVHKILPARFHAHSRREGDTDKWLLLEIQSTLRYPRDSATRNLV